MGSTDGNTALANDEGNTTTEGDTIHTESSSEDVKWFDGLGDDLKGNEALTGHDNLDGFVQASLKDRTDLAELREKIPIIPDKYKLDSEGADKDALVRFEGEAKNLGLTQEQAAGVVAFNKQRFGEVQQEMVNNEVKALDEVKAEWGTNYDANLKLAERAVEVFGGKEFKTWLNETRLVNNPVMMKLFHNIGAKMSEDSFITDTTGDIDGTTLLDDTGGKKLDFSKSMAHLKK